MYNKVILVGNLTRNIELRYLPSGGAVANTGIATNRKWKDKESGNQREEVCFIDITFFGRTAEVANQYLKRGNKVLVEGRLKLDQWTDQNGQKRSKHTIVVESMQMLNTDNKNNAEGNAGYQQTSQRTQTSQQNSQGQKPVAHEEIPDIDIDEDEIPF